MGRAFSRVVIRAAFNSLDAANAKKGSEIKTGVNRRNVFSGSSSIGVGRVFKTPMKLRNRSVLAGAALVAVGAVVGAWVDGQNRSISLQLPTSSGGSAIQCRAEVSFRAGFGSVDKKVQPAVVSVMSTTRQAHSSSSAVVSKPALTASISANFPVAEASRLMPLKVRASLGVRR